jgi:hypothetical protein
MLNTNNNVTPLTWKELREGYKYLLSENLMVPEYRIKLQHIDNCFINGCYINKINLLPKYDTLSHRVLTTKIDQDFIDMAICPNHSLPIIQVNLFDNTSHEIAYLMSATSLVKLKNYDFTPLLNICLESKVKTDKKSKITFDKVVNEINNEINSKIDKYYNKEQLKIYNKAKLGLLTNINDLRSALNYAIENEFLYNPSGNNALKLIISEFTDIYKDYRIYYKDSVNESLVINDFDKLNSNFNKLVREAILKITNQLKNEYDLPTFDESYQLILKNLDSIRSNFIRNNSNFAANQLFVVLKSNPNQNNLFHHDYIDPDPIKTYLYLLYDLFPYYETFFAENENLFTSKRFIARITLDNFLKLNLLFESIIESNIYPITEKPMIMDATIFWSNDVNSPYYFFDDAFLVAKNI